MNNDLISREALKNTFENACIYGLPMNELYGAVLKIIDYAPTVDIPDLEEYEDMANALNMASELLHKKRPTGEWVRKEDVIHSIAKQYIEHNEVVPIWLSIGDMKGGAKND